MRQLFVLLLLVYSTCCIQSQALKDAIELRKQVGKGQYFKETEEAASVTVPILLKYFDNLNTALEGNPYIGADGSARIMLSDDFQTDFVKASDLPSRKEDDNMGGNFKLPNIGGLDITYIADGLAKFLVKRSKEELTVAFFRRLQNAVENDPHMQGFFPATSSILARIGDEIYQYHIYIDLLREAAQKDLRSIPTHLAVFADTTRMIEFEYQRLFLQDGLEATQLLFDQADPYEIFAYFANDAHIQFSGLVDSTRHKVIDAASGIKTAFILSESLRNSDSTWYSAKEIREFLNDSTILDLYMGLIWQQTAGILFSNDKSVQAFLQSLLIAKDTLYVYKNYLSQLGRELNEMRQQFKNITVYLDTLEVANVQQQLYEDMLHSLLQILGEGAVFAKDFILSKNVDAPVFDYVGIFQSLSQLHFDVRQRHYMSAIFDLTEVVTIAGVDTKSLDNILKYGTFMATIAEADNSDQVAVAIEAVALPVGSSVLKKRSTWSVEFNAYAGIGLGTEYLQNTDPGRFIAIAAPIGLNLSRGFGDNGSLGLFIPLIDVGALAAYRYQDPTTTDLPKLSLNNIIAPGGYLVYGFGADIPISIGLGGQLGPNLRQIVSGTQTEFASGWRIGAFLGVDIPIFRLYGR